MEKEKTTPKKKLSELDLSKDGLPETPKVETPEEKTDLMADDKKAMDTDNSLPKVEMPEEKEMPMKEFLDMGAKAAEKYQQPKPAIKSKEMDATLSSEERIEAFIEDKKDWVKLNDFLKALYPIPRFNEPPVYLDKGEMKRMRILLDNMQSHGKLQIKDNGHGKLGNHYYEGEQQYAKFWHIGNLTIEAKK